MLPPYSWETLAKLGNVAEYVWEAGTFRLQRVGVVNQSPEWFSEPQKGTLVQEALKVVWKSQRPWKGTVTNGRFVIALYHPWLWLVMPVLLDLHFLYLLNIISLFPKSACFHHEDGGSIMLQNVGNRIMLQNVGNHIMLQNVGNHYQISQCLLRRPLCESS